MSKKYIIEIEEAPYMNVRTISTKLYKAVGFKSLVFDQEGLDKLAPYIEPADQGSYQRGLDDAWDAAKKIACSEKLGGYSWDELTECFGKIQSNFPDMLADCTAAEVIEIIREYEERKVQFRVGDEVQQVSNDGTPTGDYCIITNIGNDEFTGINRHGKSVLCSSQITRWWRKTGRHVDLSQLFGGEDA